VNQGTRLSFSWASTSMPRTAKLYLQRPFGTSHVYKRVKTLSKHHGATTAPGVTMGRYPYRVVAVRHHKTIAVSNIVRIYSYGTVTLSQLCSNDQDAQFDDCETGTTQIGSSVFNYAGVDGRGDTGADETSDTSFTHSSCRAGVISYGISNDDADGDSDLQASSVEITQAAADPVSSTAPIKTLGSLTFGLSSSSWDIDFYTTANGDDYSRIYWNGAFNCWSPNGES
jgi:hypothetical protein